MFPYALVLVPDAPVPDLPSLDGDGRDGLALLLVDVLERLDRVFDAQTPYMLWIHQRPFDGGDWPQARLHVEIVSPWRSPGVPRFVAAGRARLRGVLQPRRARGRRAVAPRSRPVSAQALDALLYPGGSRSWQNPELTSLNRLPPRATLERDPSLRRSLDGDWGFRLVGRPEEATRALGLARGWDPVPVPGLWTMQGYDIPQYTNVQMPFPDPPPTVPEENPTGLYRRTFTAPRGWAGRRVRLHFGGVEGALHVLLNGSPVGISKDARTPAEFDVTDLVRRRGPNELVAVVVRWSDASFIEDQDQWWHAGISREVALCADDSIPDVFVTRRRRRPADRRAPRAGSRRPCSTRAGRRSSASASATRSRRASARRGSGRPRSRRSTRSSSGRGTSASPAASASAPSRSATGACS